MIIEGTKSDGVRQGKLSTAGSKSTFRSSTADGDASPEIDGASANGGVKSTENPFYEGGVSPVIIVVIVILVVAIGGAVGYFLILRKKPAATNVEGGIETQRYSVVPNNEIKADNNGQAAI